MNVAVEARYNNITPITELNQSIVSILILNPFLAACTVVGIRKVISLVEGNRRFCVPKRVIILDSQYFYPLC